MKFFKKMTSSSVFDAKSRLKSVLKNDRINVEQNATIEKISKEVMTVLLKYSQSAKDMPKLTVSCRSGSVCTLAATIPLVGNNIKENVIK